MSESAYVKPARNARTASRKPGGNRNPDKPHPKTPEGRVLVDPDKPLTDKQRLFVKFWAQGESILSASVKAGYVDGGSVAYQMVYRPNILKAYNAEKEKYERDSGMTRKRVIDGLLESIEIAKTLAEPSSMIAGWREVAKIVGYYAPVEVKSTVTHEGKVQLEKLDRLSDAELMELIAQQAKAMAAPQLPSPEETTDDETGADTP